MGTRADFYVGVGPNAEWLGSLAMDGYRIDEADADTSGLPPRHRADAATCWAVKSATDEATYRAAVATLLNINDDATTPEQGWPWPWNDSRTTDYAYCFEGNKTVPYSWGRPLPEDRDSEQELPERADWPDMSARSNFTLGPRSGVIVVGA
jgi:hypothetical protein